MNLQTAIKTLRTRIQQIIDYSFSIRFRLILWYAFLLCLVTTSFSVFIYLRQVQDTQQVVFNHLRLKLDRLISGYRQPGFNPPFVLIPGNSTSQDPWNAWFHEGDVLAITDVDGNVQASWGSLAPETIQILDLIPPGWSGGREIEFDSQLLVMSHPPAPGNIRYMFISVPLTQDDQVAAFVLMGTAFDPNNQLSQLMVSLIIGSLLTMLAALGGGYWLADRAMRPVQRITQAAQQISETDLNLRLKIKGRDELARLANTFDAMLDRLQAAFDRQRQFTADASHEIRTPLTIIDLEAGRALAARRSPAEYERVLRVIQSENQFMTRLVTNLLALARMDAGQTALAKEPVDLGDLTLEVVERLTPLAARNGVTLTCGELPELKTPGDRQYLLQMLTNLIENAIKYSRPQDASVLVNLTEETAKGRRWAVVEISDNGVGISTEHLPHLFDRFYRVDEVRSHAELEHSPDSDTSSGTGLGLAITLKIAEAHQGTIRVKSEPGVGSTFEAVLPLN